MSWAKGTLSECMPIAHSVRFLSTPFVVSSLGLVDTSSPQAFSALGVKSLPPNTHIFASQHLLGTVALMVKAFRTCGAADIHVLGKCYSTHPAVFKHLLDEGFKVERRSIHFDSHESFDVGFDASTTSLCGKIQALLEKTARTTVSEKPNVVIMDDGGMLLEKVNEMLIRNRDLRSSAKRLFGVEQTSSGANRLNEYMKSNRDNGKSSGLCFPIYNVARSRAKLTCESPLISYFTLPRVLHHTVSTQSRNDQNIEALVIGGGPIGVTVAQRLCELGIPTKIFDRDSKSSTEATNKVPPILLGGNEDLTELVSVSNLIIGATGRASVTPDIFTHLQDNTSLISISSSDREFSACDLRKYAERTNIWNKNVEVVIPETAHRVTLGYSGFPLTFDDNCSHAGEPEEMQLTMALLIASVLEGLTNISLDRYELEMINLDEELQGHFIDQFDRLGITEMVRQKYTRLAAAAVMH